MLGARLLNALLASLHLMLTNPVVCKFYYYFVSKAEASTKAHG